MRPLRLLLSLCTSLLLVTLLLYAVYGTHNQERLDTPHVSAKKGRLNALFSFTSPASLFPPSAVISLTDDNSTFFLARPAAFGPLLPSKGLSGPLWIGSGFGDDAALGRGELGCSDIPGWNDGKTDSTQKETSGKHRDEPLSEEEHTDVVRTTQRTKDRAVEDGTDDYLQDGRSLPSGKKVVEHADIQSLQENAEMAGKVILLKRGGCGFLEKVNWAQRRGGVALIVGDDVRGGALIRMYAQGDTSNVTIPALFTSHTTAHLLSSLIPSGGILQDLSPEEAAKLGLTKKPGQPGKNSGKKKAVQDDGGSPKIEKTPQAGTEAGWIRPLLSALGIGATVDEHSREHNQRPPTSGNLDWVKVEDWEDEPVDHKPTKTRLSPYYTTPESPGTSSPGEFVIGEHDWRDSGLSASKPISSAHPRSSTRPNIQQTHESPKTLHLPGSGEYDSQDGHSGEKSTSSNKHHNGWIDSWFGDDKKEDENDLVEILQEHETESKGEPSESGPHEGLWVTLTPTNMSSSPFFDTLLVLVVSPLVTLTVVYSLLLLRSRIRRRRWRAPKSVVERLPVRTYQTISDTGSSPSATPNASSPTTPLLQHTPSRPTSSHTTRPRSRTESEVPATSSSFQPSGLTPEEEKREAGLAAWRRRYGGRQRECVVCLEEYIDGISRVMSLPCGHEFHEECITPWLVTRRRTCPICKGDVVRSLSHSYRSRNLLSPSPTRSSQPLLDDMDDLQAEAAETRNDFPSASRPVPIAGGGNLDGDMEANWEDDTGEGRSISRDALTDLSSSMRNLSSSVVTTIWRGFDAVRSATGLQRRPSREEVDRDR
ncbi:hypothetical protein EJ04DRAFT_486234 [Polyplosphaeria fusca]|uniref:RING-type domain-containing protein n=1 Tax=Polyplosphaeria fusca TaxID=682080 RepID=A0A9P4R7C2_9PLEO|nr:hypothetical protein EJ04DRAFT_486234 [Polyplosphaeria fusca]